MAMGRDIKVVVIGLDGADWRLLEPWIESGNLPTLARLVSEGTRGKLRSTTRPESSVAWSSFSTGVNPGKHGVFGFVERAANDYAYKLANAASVRSRRFWDFLGEQGIRVGILNLPFTYPPSPVNGFLVTGMLTPGPHVPFAYPQALQEQLLERFGHYKFDIGNFAQDKAALIDDVRSYTRQQRETALFLLREWSWDFFTVVFTGPDRLQHFLWADLDSKHPLRDPENAQRSGDALLEHYRELDSAIAEILTCLPVDTLVLVMSDHGFNGCARRFFVNAWLCEQGWLRLNDSSSWQSNLASVLSRVGSIQWVRRLKRIIAPTQWGSSDLSSAIFNRSIDWKHTKAYFGLDGGLRINLQGREPEGIVRPDEYSPLCQTLRQSLLALTDPETKSPPLANVFPREELYQGPYTPRAPDLILEPRRDNQSAAQNFVLDSTLKPNGVHPFGSSQPYSGNHTLDGILIAWGADVVKGGQIKNAQIIDLAPTILAVMGVPVPADMDGRVLSKIFTAGRAPAAQYVAVPSVAASEEVEESFSPEEERTVESRLRGLGYLD
jgi:predicted AlkP superfamily phosphohydrolase/phosphomutase